MKCSECGTETVTDWPDFTPVDKRHDGGWAKIQCDLNGKPHSCVRALVARIASLELEVLKLRVKTC